MKDTSKEQKIKILIEKLEKDAEKLPLAKHAKDTVPPEGNPDAQLMFIGEAAGYHEHQQRRPFVGPAGKLLQKSLEEIGIKREDVWISNILKVRPPQNRDPLPKEIEAYRPYLDREIQIIAPKIIATLGRFSMAKFIPNTYISQIHGQARWVDWNGTRIIIFPMYHPAAALRNGKVLQMFKQDFIKLAQIINTLNNQSEARNEAEEPINKSEEVEDKQLQLI